MSAALSVFKLNVQSVRQLQQHKNRSLFRNHRVALSVNSAANHSTLKQGSLKLGNVGWFLAYIASQYCTSHDNPMDSYLATEISARLFLSQNHSLITCSLWKLHISVQIVIILERKQILQWNLQNTWS